MDESTVFFVRWLKPTASSWRRNHTGGEFKYERKVSFLTEGYEPNNLVY